MSPSAVTIHILIVHIDCSHDRHQPRVQLTSSPDPNPHLNPKKAPQKQQHLGAVGAVEGRESGDGTVDVHCVRHQRPAGRHQPQGPRAADEQAAARAPPVAACMAGGRAWGDMIRWLGYCEASRLIRQHSWLKSVTAGADTDKRTVSGHALSQCPTKNHIVLSCVPMTARWVSGGADQDCIFAGTCIGKLRPLCH